MKKFTRIASTLGIVAGVFLGSAGLAFAAAYAVGVGGTGWTNIQAGHLIYGNGSDKLATTTGEAYGSVVSYDGTKPTYIATSTLKIAQTDLTGFGTGCQTFLGTPSSANLAGCITDEQGTAGFVVFSVSPTFTGTITAPIARGGTAVGSQLILRGSTNASPTAGTAGIIFQAGASGTTEAGRVDGSTGNFGLGTTSPYAKLAIGGGNVVLGGATAGGTPGDLFLPKYGAAAGAFAAFDPTGKLISTTTPAGGVSTISIASANGFAGSSSGGTNPALTLSTSITGLLKGNGTAISSAANGTDYTLITANTCSAGQHVSAITAAGVITCSADSGGGGGSGNVATSTTETAGNLAYWTSSGATPATLGKVGTSTITLGSGLSGTAFGAIGGVDQTITATLGTNITPNELNNAASANSLIYTDSTAALFKSVATSSLAFSSAFSGASSLGALVSGSNSTIDLASNGVALTKLATIGANTILGNNTGATGNVVAFATSTLGIAISDTTGTLAVSRGGTGVGTFTSSQLLYGNGTNALSSAATTTLGGGTTGLTFSNTPAVIGASPSALAGTLVVGNGGTGVATLTGVAVGNGTSAFTAGSAQTCTNQFVRSMSASYVATCATVGAADVSLAALTATNATLTFSGSYTGATARTIGLNLGNANTWTALQTFSAAASTTQFSVGNRLFVGGTATTTINADALGSITMGSNSVLTLGTTTAGTLQVSGTGVVYSAAASGYSPVGTIGQMPYFNGTNTILATSTLTISTASHVGVGSTTPWAVLGVGNTPIGPMTTVASTSVWTTAGSSFAYTAPAGTSYVQFSMWGGGGATGNDGAGAGAYVGSTTVFMKSGDTGTIYIAAGGSGTAGGAGYKTGGTASAGGGGGGSTAFTASSTGAVYCAAGGGGAGSSASQNGLAATSNGGAAGTNAGAGAAATAGSGTVAGTGCMAPTFASGDGSTGGAGQGGGAAGASGAGLSGNAGGTGSGGAGHGINGATYEGGGGGNFGGPSTGGSPAAGGGGGGGGGGGKLIITAYTSSSVLAGVQLVAGPLVVNEASAAIGTTSAQSASWTVQGLVGGVISAYYQTIGGVVYLVEQLDRFGHLGTGGPVPSVVSCGTTPSITGNDRTMIVITGSGTVNSCGVNFAKAYDIAPTCVATFQSGTTVVAASASVSGISLAFSGTSPTRGVNIICQYYK